MMHERLAMSEVWSFVHDTLLVFPFELLNIDCAEATPAVSRYLLAQHGWSGTETKSIQLAARQLDLL
jgi:hypothetical protein